MEGAQTFLQHLGVGLQKGDFSRFMMKLQHFGTGFYLALTNR